MNLRPPTQQSGAIPAELTSRRYTFGSKATLDLPKLILCLYRSLLRVKRVKRVGIHEIEYRPGRVLRLHEMDDLENDYPVYGQVDEIIVWEDEKFFILTEL